MGPRPLFVYFSAAGRAAPACFAEFVAQRGLDVLALVEVSDVLALVNRTYPAGVLIDPQDAAAARALCRQLKTDAFSAIVPVVTFAPADRADVVLAALEAGADEVLTDGMELREQLLRLQMMLHRAERDVSVHPTTRLPGTIQIERDIADRMRRRELFAVCYADLDHFKEFNDRYGYNEGDRVIRMLARILRDVVKGHSPEGFIGHIGGDDFIFNIALDRMHAACEEIIEVFDTLVPYQYTEDDRRAGYFLGRDRRGNILWVPLMTLSIGVVTNQQRVFTHTARVSELATEMKNFAKKLPGSVFAVDRRSDRNDMPIYGRRSSDQELELSSEP
ncbi:MAG: diguanylate cyclase [Gemmatimonadetes bacterium]|nr:diguanylate cyclase [Gemmatimonadota bacterium]